MRLGSPVLWFLNPLMSSRVILKQSYELRFIYDVVTIDTRTGKKETFSINPKLGTLSQEEYAKLRDSCFESILVFDRDEIERQRCKKVLKKVNKNVKIFRNQSKRRRDVEKTCMKCHQTMNIDDYCQCLLDVSAKITARAMRNVANKSTSYGFEDLTE